MFPAVLTDGSGLCSPGVLVVSLPKGVLLVFSVEDR